MGLPPLYRSLRLVQGTDCCYAGISLALRWSLTRGLRWTLLRLIRGRTKQVNNRAFTTELWVR